LNSSIFFSKTILWNLFSKKSYERFRHIFCVFFLGGNQKIIFISIDFQKIKRLNSFEIFITYRVNLDLNIQELDLLGNHKLIFFFNFKAEIWVFFWSFIYRSKNPDYNNYENSQKKFWIFFDENSKNFVFFFDENSQNLVFFFFVEFFAKKVHFKIYVLKCSKFHFKIYVSKCSKFHFRIYVSKCSNSISEFTCKNVLNSISKFTCQNALNSTSEFTCKNVLNSWFVGVHKTCYQFRVFTTIVQQNLRVKMF
jgi:hypothetical protein